MPRLSWPDLLASGRPALGTWSQIASEECIDLLGSAALDFTIVDLEHGAFGIDVAERLFRACDANGLVPFARIARADPALVGQALDAGAAAVVVPGVSSATHAAELVAAGWFAPDGTRGACPCVRSGGQFVRDWPAYVAAQRACTGVIALVETRAGLDDIENIAAVPGLLALMIGPFDLAVSLGHGSDYLAEDVQDAIDRMMKAASANALPVFAPVFDPNPHEARRQRERWSARGASHFVVGTDKILFSDAVAGYAAAMR